MLHQIKTDILDILTRIEQIDNRSNQMEIIKPATYAKVTHTQINKHNKTQHSIKIKSTDVIHTSGDVITEIRKAIEAPKIGITVDSLRKVKDQGVVLDCNTKEGVTKLAQWIKDKAPKLIVQEVKNRDPLIIIKDVQNDISDEDIKTMIKK